MNVKNVRALRTATRAQLSYFLLVGIIIGALFLFATIALKPRIGPVDFTDPSSTKLFVERCIEDTARYGLFQLGLQGGYITLPEQHAEVAHLAVAYAFNGGNTLVGIPTMERELAQFLDGHLTDCVDNGIAAFEERFGKMRYAAPQTTTHVQRDDVRFTVEFPITISTEKSTVTYDKPYQVEIPVRLSRIHEAIASIIREHTQTGHLLKLECSMEKDFTITGESFGSDNLFILEDSKSIIRNSPDRLNEKYRFFFVMRDRE